ncbi:MAG: CapA family protein [Ruminococcaceae bacterium]|nr:CapA family protein [Oscillospiraceae bacterium]
MKTLLMGDICATDQSREVFIRKDMDVLFGDTLELFKNNDVTFVNVECAITDSENRIKKFGPNLKSPRETADVLKNLGVTLCGLSNNHIFDFGIEGARDTMKALDEVGIAYTGFGENYEDSRRNYFVEKNGEKVCFITVCEHEYSYALDNRMGSRPFDPFDTMADIRAAKAEADRVIVLYHGGKEHCQYPSPRLMKACREMVHNGADVILCQHTHCISCYENYMGSHILYGQGNFHFVKLSANMPETWNSLLAVQYDTVTNEITFTPIVNNEYGVELAKGEKKEELMNGFAARNASLEDGSWQDGWHEFCVKMQNNYIKAANGDHGSDPVEMGDSVFAHYLDCEAHTDVWRELYKTANHRNELG